MKEKIIVFTRYDLLGASSRIRFSLYFDFLEQNNFILEVHPLFSNKYLLLKYQNKSIVLELLVCYFKRLWSLHLLFTNKFIWLEKEFFPYLPPFAEYLCKLLGKRLIVDYDDAIFHNYDINKNGLIRYILGNKIDLVMRFSSIVVAGNSYIANRAKLTGASTIVQIPTVINFELYRKYKKNENTKITIGWIGTPQTSKYLLNLIPVFEKLLEKYVLKIVAIGGNPQLFKDTVIDVVPWADETELSLLSNIDIGIMPLDSTPWEMGKCGYKIIQYFGCGIPVVASRVGANIDIVDHSVNGFLCESNEEWFIYLSKLIESKELRNEFGCLGNQKVFRQYSLESNSERILDLFKTKLSV